MTAFLAEWAVRSAAIISIAAVLMKALRVKDPTLRLAAWTAVLFGSLLIPVLRPSIPALRVPVPQAPKTAPGAALRAIGASRALPGISPSAPRAAGSGAAAALAAVYLLGAGTLLLRLAIGMILGRRLTARSRATGLRLSSGEPIHESADLPAPATFGILRPVVVLPSDWRAWEKARLESILAHERSHMARHDPALQLLSALHRAVLWFNPAAWFLHRQIVWLAEEASDDAALAAGGDRATYAEVVLHFVQRAVQPVRWEGVAMARYGKADARIHRILDETRISRGMTRLGWVAVLTAVSPLVYLAAAARPAAMPVRPAAFAAAAAVAESSSPQQGGRITNYVIVSGTNSEGSWDSRNHPNIDALRARYGSDFVWFLQDGHSYVVADEKVMEELRAAMAPQEDVNRMQADVNQRQHGVNEMQAEVNRHQGEVNRRQAEVNRVQSEVNERQRDGYTDEAGQSRANAMQAEVNDLQKGVNGEQAKVNDAQSLVNEAQKKVNAEQRRVSPLVEAAVHDVLDSAVTRGLAHSVSGR